MSSANPATSNSANVTAAPQPNHQTGSNNQVRAGDACHQQEQPPPPQRSSSLLPTLRRRASEPMPHSHRQRYIQRPGDTHTRYTYGFNQRGRCSGYTFGFAQRDADIEYSHDDMGYTQNDVYRPGMRYEYGPVSHSQTLSSLNSHTQGNLNRNRYEYGHTRSRTPVDTQGHLPLDNARGHTFVDAQGNTHSCKPTHTRTHSSQSNSYTENIRAMAGQMYADPPTQSRRPTRSHTNRDTHSYNYAHNRALTRHHNLRLSGGL